MHKKDGSKLPTISMFTTAGLSSIDQIINKTSDEQFSFQQGTSDNNIHYLEVNPLPIDPAQEEKQVESLNLGR